MGLGLVKGDPRRRKQQAEQADLICANNQPNGRVFALPTLGIV